MGRMLRWWWELGVDVWIRWCIGNGWIEISLFVDEMFSLETDSDFTWIVPKLSLPLLIKIYDVDGAKKGETKITHFLGIIKSSRNPSLLYKSHRFSFECSTLFVESRSKRIFLRRYFSRIDLNRLSASVASGMEKIRKEMSLWQITLRQIGQCVSKWGKCRDLKVKVRNWV